MNVIFMYFTLLHLIKREMRNIEKLIIGTENNLQKYLQG